MVRAMPRPRRGRELWLIVILVLVALVACEGTHRPARTTYNEGLAALTGGDFAKAELLLSQAYGDAGVDPDLRFHAAYNLGVAYAADADRKKKGDDEDPEQALALLRDASGWLQRAAQHRPSDAAAKTNLAIVRARIQAITDELRGEGKLAQRLEELIAAQRGVLDGARAAWETIQRTSSADPLAQQTALVKLADAERAVLADAGVAVDLAADEIDVIAKKPEDKRSNEERLRLGQLRGVDTYLEDARSRLGEARRKLQELAAEPGVTRAEAALVALKRARDQLLDPVTVLRTLGQDELALAAETISAGAGRNVLGGGSGDPVPGWLAPPALAARQHAIRDRLDDLKAQLAAAVVQPASEPKPGEPPPDPKQAKLLDRVRQAMPGITDASAEMERAGQALGAGQLSAGLEREQAAAAAIARAVEQFSDLKQTIELAYREQVRIGTLLEPEAAKELEPAVRSKETRDGLARNQGRASRLAALIAEQLAELAGQDPAGSGDEQAKREQLDQLKQQLARAEELRGQAATALDALGKALDARNGDPLPPARDAEARLLELRKLFFSVIEHLQQLIRDQGETRDQTSAIAGADDFTRAPKLPLLVGREDEHATVAKALVDALAAQADAAGKAPPPQPGTPQAPKQGPDAKTLAAAAEEVRQAGAQIGDARGTLAKVQAPGQSSQSIKPALDAQGKALEHLQRALELLQPKGKNKQDDKQQQQQQDPQQDKQKQQDQQQQQGAAQRARDDDARRQQQRHQGSGADNVEQDW
jgi:Ca-activated chloride channel homolog